MSKCDDCGTELIDCCYCCGAPVCCPKCCAETTEELLKEQEMTTTDETPMACAWPERKKLRRKHHAVTVLEIPEPGRGSSYYVSLITHKRRLCFDQLTKAQAISMMKAIAEYFEFEVIKK